MESPVIIENCAQFGQPVDTNETGFPFDDSDYDSHDHIQARLNDIASRHPEFANHFRFDDFPSLRRKRHGSGSSGDQEERFGPAGPSGPSYRFANHNFPSGFNRFPFTEHFEDEFAGSSNREEKPPEVPKSQEKRGRKPNPYLPQHLSNTVDLGQKQPPVEGNRSQRSMSAPPENRSQTPRFDNEPANTKHQEETQQPNMGKTFSRQGPAQPKERIIPIHVEGRDDPVMPKNPNINSTASAEKVFGGERVQSGFQPQYQHQRQPDPQAQYRKQMYEQFVPNRSEQQQRPATAKQQTPPAQPQPQPQHHHQQQQQQQHQQQQQQTPSPQPQPQRSQATPPPLSNDPLDKIKCVRSDVMELMTKVEKFSGTRKDREYLYLDEMLTRNLLKLDNIETDGKDNIRMARKEAIKCIQTCINNLEAKAQAKEKQIKSEAAAAAPEQTVVEAATPAVAEPQQPVEIEAEPPKFTSQASIIISKPVEEQQPSAEAQPATMDVEPVSTSKEAQTLMEVSENLEQPVQTAETQLDSSQNSKDSTEK